MEIDPSVSGAQNALQSTMLRFRPATLEQWLGIGLLATAISMIPRPYAAGLENLYLLYGVFVSARAYGALLALCGGIFILQQRVGRKTFALLYAPIPIYTMCLIFYFLKNPNVGPLGSAALIGLSLLLPLMYSKRATRREVEAARGLH